MQAIRMREVPVVAWIFAALVILTGVVAVTGGFRTASTSWKGVETEAGTVVHTRFWDIALYEAHVTSWGYVEVSAQLAYKLPEPGYVDQYLLVVNVPDQDLRMPGPSCHTYNNRPFNPEVVVTAVCSFSAPEGRELDVEGLSELEIEVIVFDQGYSDNILDGRSPRAENPHAYYKFTAPVVE